MLGFHLLYFLIISLVAFLVFSAMGHDDIPAILNHGIKRFLVFTLATAAFGGICWGLMEVF